MKMMAVLLNAGTLLMAGCSSIRPTGQHLSHAEYRSIARGCVHLLRTVGANETFIPISDPRVSSAIRAQGPQAVYVVGSIEVPNARVVIVRSGRPAVYEFWLRPSYPKEWILFG